jgi:hypothetical protein
MEKVKLGGDWCYEDVLAGKALRDGEQVRVQWPDGSVTDETIRVERRPYQVSDMGRSYPSKDDHAYIETAVRGALARTYLRKSELLVERVPAGDRNGDPP